MVAESAIRFDKREITLAIIQVQNEASKKITVLDVVEGESNSKNNSREIPFYVLVLVSIQKLSYFGGALKAAHRSADMRGCEC